MANRETKSLDYGRKTIALDVLTQYDYFQDDYFQDDYFQTGAVSGTAKINTVAVNFNRSTVRLE